MTTLSARFLLSLIATAALAACSTTPLPPADAPPASRLVQDLSPAPAAVAAIVPAQPAPVVAPAVEPPPTAQLEDNLQPDKKINLDEPLAQADLWARMRGGFSMPALDNELVQKAELWYASRPDYVARMTERGSRYLYHIVEEIDKRGLPAELALLPFIESAFVTDASSRVKAVGMWQFMPATGRDFDLKQNIFRDDRRDVLASTRAALDYLTRLHKMFGDWQLALAAYNWGQGNVAKAIARNHKAGKPTDYESLDMPAETRYYIPKLQAVKNIVLDPARYGLVLGPLANHPYFLSVSIDRDIDLERAASFAGMALAEFKLFNPQMNKPVILANAGSGDEKAQILLPYANAAIFVKGLERHRGPLASWTAWVVPKTMKPGEAAARVGMSEVALRELNKIPPKMLVKAGSTLLVPRTAKRDVDVSEHLADNASIKLAPDAPAQKRLALKAGKGDTVASVAARYKVSAAQLAMWNKVGVKAAFKPGQQVVVYTPAASKKAGVRTAAKRPTQKKSAAQQAKAAVQTSERAKARSAT